MYNIGLYSFDSSSTGYTLNLEEPSKLIIKSFGYLPVGWDFGEGGKISRYVINRAIKVFEYFKNFNLSHEITPFSDDTIQISYKFKDDFFDILISKSKYSFKHENGIGLEYKIIEEFDNLSLEKINYRISEKINICSLSEQYISVDLAEVKGDLNAVLQTSTGDYRSSINPVQNLHQDQFVVTSDPITPIQLMSL